MKKVIINVLLVLMMVATAVMPVRAKDQVVGEFILGKVGSIPEVKTVMERQCAGRGALRICVMVPVVYRRTSTMSLVVSYKSDKLNEKIKKVINECSKLGAAISVGVYIKTQSVNAALSAFMPIFNPCVKANAIVKGLDVNAKLVVKQTDRTDWKRSS